MEQELVLDVKVKNQGLKQQLREAVKEAQALVAAGDTSSESYKKATKRVAELKDQIKDFNEEVKALDPGEKFKTIAGVSASIAGGFQAAQGAMALFGAESKDVEKALLKVQAATALAQGIDQVREFGKYFNLAKAAILDTAIGTRIATVAQRAYNAVMAANPIGLLIAGLTALVGVIALVVNAMGDEEENQQKVIKSREREIELLNANNEAYKRNAEFRKNLAAAQGKTAEDLLKMDKQFADERKKQIDSELDLIKKNIQDRIILMKNADDDEFKELQEKNNKDYEQRKKLYDERYNLDASYIVNKAKLDTDTAKKDEEKRKEAIQKAIDHAKKLKELREKEAEEEYQFRLKRLEQERELDAKHQKDKLDQASKDFNDTLKAGEDRHAALLQSLRDQAAINLMQNKDSIEAQKEVENADFQSRVEALKLFQGKTKEEQEANKLAIEKLTAEHNNKLNDIETNGVNARIAKRQAETEAILQLAQTSLNGLVALAELGIKNEKKLEQAKKIAALVQIGIDTARAISGIVAAASMDPKNALTGGLDIPLKIAAGIVTVLANMAKAKQILSASGSSGSAPSLSTAAIPTSTSAGIAGGGVTMQQGPAQQGQTIANANLINNAMNNQNMIRAVVVETDITDSQRRVRGIEDRATFG